MSLVWLFSKVLDIFEKLLIRSALEFAFSQKKCYFPLIDFSGNHFEQLVHRS